MHLPHTIFPTLFTRLLLLLLLLLPSHASAWTNPLRNPGGSDPFLTYAGDGYYYLLTTTWTDVAISRAPTLAALKDAPETRTVFSTTTASLCCNVWAPEVHYLDGTWYLYFTAGEASSLDGQRLHVLKGGATPWDTYTYAGQLTTEWAIDASVLRFASHGTWLMFSCMHNGAPYQSICLQELAPGYTALTGPISLISSPTQAWEQVAYPVNEGPAALYFPSPSSSANNTTMTTYISYAASYCWSPAYCIGLLTWDGTTPPQEPAAWTKSDGCVFASDGGHYGTAHNGFFQSPDASQTWLVYHATANAAGACDDSRYTMVQPLGTQSNGSPDFGSPVDFAQAFGEPSGGLET